MNTEQTDTTTESDHNESVKHALVSTCFSEARLAIVGWLLAMLLHIGLMAWGGLPDWQLYGGLLVGLIVVIGVFIFSIERFVQSTAFLTYSLNSILILGFGAMGLYIVYSLLNIPNEDLRLVTYALTVGVIGAGTLTFTSSRGAFLSMSLPLSTTVFYYSIVMMGTLSHFILGGMLIIYQVVLILLAERDFRRRRALFHTQLVLSDEKQALAHTLQTVEKLKQQQDGDYFLTSLLLKPLGVNRSENQQVTIEFLVAQKKKFQFKGKEQEIGGDICIAHDIQLRERDYTVVLNADAMGKSMQGAGGALVIGSVFQAIVERTKSSTEIQSKYPERWLKNAFLELKSVFESFEGSMMVSMIIGLVDTQNGLLYYLNIEHPWSILFRDGTAGFIEESPSHYKLGVTIATIEVHLMTFQMQPGDVVVLGSDGRDDLMVQEVAQPKRIMNSDENQILDRIKEAGGKLEDIYSRLKLKGELTDDLSLLRIEYSGNSPIQVVGKAYEDKLLTDWQKLGRPGSLTPEIIQLLSNYSELALKRLTRKLYDTSEHTDAALVCEHLSNLFPMQHEYLYLASVCLRKAGRHNAAADFGERLLLREPDHIKNTIHLAKLHLYLKNVDRADELLRLAERFKLSNLKFDELKHRLKQPAG